MLQSLYCRQICPVAACWRASCLNHFPLSILLCQLCHCSRLVLGLNVLPFSSLSFWTCFWGKPSYQQYNFTCTMLPDLTLNISLASFAWKKLVGRYQWVVKSHFPALDALDCLTLASCVRLYPCRPQCTLHQAVQWRCSCYRAVRVFIVVFTEQVFW